MELLLPAWVLDGCIYVQVELAPWAFCRSSTCLFYTLFRKAQTVTERSGRSFPALPPPQWLGFGLRFSFSLADGKEFLSRITNASKTDSWPRRHYE
jgi:hypothetical protein